jgi:hypothetical protein
MDAPGTRYKVVERGRRLEVIDTWNGDAPVQKYRDPTAPSPRSSDAGAAVKSMRSARLDQQGRTILNTAAWYDAKGPRTLTLSEQGEANWRALRIFAVVAAIVGVALAYLFWPFFLVVPFILLNGETRKSLRGGATKFLDALSQAET